MRLLIKFFSSESASGILLCIATLFALILANSPFAKFYALFKNVPVILQIGAFIIDKPLLLWINDGLMAIFFLVVGLEIKRELIEGHLSSREKFILPALAAIGGILCPALLYSYINWGNELAIKGWAIPGATDIAFALGVLIMMGSRVPNSLKICLMAIAVIDDLAAIVIIALFYTTDISLLSLSLAGIGLLLAICLNMRNVTHLGPYMLLGLFIWACVLKSGVHATLAGVILGLIIPLKAKNTQGNSPLHVLEHALTPYVAFGVIPIFAFANAGISLQGITLNTLLEPITLGIMVGLFLGKQLGVMLFVAMGCGLKLIRLPQGVNYYQFYGMAVLTGIGFTMSLFIGTLAFSDIAFALPVRLGVLLGSLMSAIVGIAVLCIFTKK